MLGLNLRNNIFYYQCVHFEIPVDIYLSSSETNSVLVLDLTGNTGKCTSNCLLHCPLLRCAAVLLLPDCLMPPCVNLS